MKTESTRRAVMAGLAAAPVAGLPAVVGAVSAAPLSEALADALESHKAAYAELESHFGPEDIPDDVLDKEGSALWKLAVAPCANDVDLIVKLRYLLAYEKRNAMDQTFDMSACGPLPIALDAHFDPEALS